MVPIVWKLELVSVPLFTITNLAVQHHLGILISGGLGEPDVNTRVEVVVPATGQFCSLPDLPDEKRYYHTMDGLYICGGKVSNCLHFSDGEWNTFVDMENTFEGHSSWAMEDGIFLLGGAIWGRATEFIPITGEQGGPAFELEHKSR